MYKEVDIEGLTVEPDLQKLENQLEAQDLMNLIQELPQGYRTIFNLYAIEGYKHHEISNLLNISEGTSKSQLFKARQMLQKKIKELNDSSYGTN